MAFHDTEPVGSVHIPYNWTYADASAREGASGLVVGDNGKLSRQLDNNSLWMLTDYSGPTWVLVGGTSSESADHLIVNVRKGSSGTITKGSPVYISGYNIGGWIEVEEADADDPTKMPALGLAEVNITSTATATVIAAGTLGGLATDVYALGANLYVSTTAGVLTDVRPTGATTLIQSVCRVIRVHGSDGQVMVVGAGRENDIPNLAENKIWKGDSNGQPQEVAFAHAASHVNGSDDIQLATSLQKGLMSSTYAGKLDGIEAGAQVNTVTSVFSRTGSVAAAASDYDASQVDNDSSVSGAFVKEALETLDAAISAVSSGYSRRSAVIDYVDCTAAPPTEVTGDRYILDFTVGTVHANWDGASKGDIVQFNGATWDAVSPEEGWVAYVDDQNEDILYVDDGTPNWEFRPTYMQSHNDLTDVSSDQHHAKNHAATHVNGTDDIQLATAAQKGLMSLTYAGKLDGIEAGADVTDAANVSAAGAVMKSLFDANTILAADTDDTPVALAVAASRILGRKASGSIAAMTTAELKTLCAYLTALSDDTNPTLSNPLILNEKTIRMNAIPAVNLTGNGFTVYVTVTQNSQGVGNAMTLNSSFQWVDAKADAAATMPCVGLAMDAGTGASKRIITYGPLRNDAWNWSRGLVWVSAATGGALTQTQPGAGLRVQPVGFALSADVIFVNPMHVVVRRSA